MSKELLKGNVAIAEAAVKAGCRGYFGYPITPQSELLEHMSNLLTSTPGGAFVQAESEVAAINMVYGAAASGARVMTSSSGPGISLKAEGISFCAGAELPCVIVNIMRGGPGLGGIQPSQADYFQATRGGGHGDFNLLVYAPDSVQEAADLTQKAFDRADFYRTPVMILADGVIGQMMEPCEIKDFDTRDQYNKDWACNATQGKRDRNIVKSIYLDPADLNDHNKKLQAKYDIIKKDEVMYEAIDCEDADVVLVAYGTTARIARSAMAQAKAEGLKVGLFRPITLWPYPYKELKEACKNAKAVIVSEMSMGQMIYDVQLALEGQKPISFIGEAGGIMPSTQQILDEINKVSKGV